MLHKALDRRLQVLELLEAQRQAQQEAEREPRYRLLTHDEVTRWVFLVARGSGMRVEPGGVLVARKTTDESADTRDLRQRVAAALNNRTDWGELLTSEELTAAQHHHAAGHFVYHVRTQSWDVFSTGWQPRDFLPYPHPYMDAAALYTPLRVAAALAERHGTAVTTPEALSAWLDTAQPFVMTPALYAAVGDMWTLDDDDESQ